MTSPNPSKLTPGPDHATQTPNAWITNPAIRKAIYGVVVAVGAVLVVVGLISQDQLNTWLELIGNIIMIGTGSLALVNTPKAS